MSVPDSPRSLGLKHDKWRPNQKELIQRLLDLDKQVALVEAPTGFGKSAVAAGLSLLCTGKVLILTKTKQLQDQYLRDFPHMRSLQGKTDYSCILPDYKGVAVSEAPCQSGFNCSLKLNECPYYVQHRLGVTSRVLVSNYAKAFSTYLGRFEWIICDEGHLLEKQIQAAYTIRLPYEDFKRVGLKIPPFGNIEDAISWAMGKKGNLDAQIDQLYAVLKETSKPDPNMRKKYFELKKVMHPLTQLCMADPNAVWAMEPFRKMFYIKPLWANSHTHTLFNEAKHVVVQSATILNGARLAGLLGVTSYDYITLPSSFPVERRPIFYTPVAKIGMKSHPSEEQKLIAAIDKILERYPRSRGIIHTVNMTLTESIGKKSKYASRMIVQSKGKNRGECIDRYMKTDYAVLVSPSVMTGLDGRFEKARFQIIAKVPFENQGDTAVKERLEVDKDWYAYQTAFNLQQAAGRVMRDEADYGETWILDAHFGWFYKQYKDLFSPWFKEAVKDRKL